MSITDQDLAALIPTAKVDMKKVFKYKMITFRC